MKKIVLALHDPITEETHVKFGTYLARELGHRLIMLQLGCDDESAAIRQGVLKKVRDRAKRQGIDVKTSFAKQFPVDELERSEKTELVIFNSAGPEFGRNDGKLGENLRLALTKTDIPVLITCNTESELRRPLFAYTGSDKSRQMLRAGLLAFGRVFKRGVALAVGKDGPDVQAAMGEAQMIAKDFGMQLETKVVDGNVTETLLAEAAANECDLIVCGAYIRNLLQRALSSSITEELIARSKLPVLTGSV